MHVRSKSQFFGLLTFVGLLLAYPTFIFTTQLKTNDQQHASENTCVGATYSCSEHTCLEKGTTYVKDKTCPQLYYNKQFHNQFCCLEKASPTPTP